MSGSPVPRIGVAVFILNDKNQFVFGQRKGSHGAGTWALPGGHLEFGESFEECAQREVLEETGLRVERIRYLTATNSVFETEKKHYVTVFMVATSEAGSGEPQLLEPNKCLGWHWIGWDEMLQWYSEKGNPGQGKEAEGESSASHPLFLPMIDLVQQRPSFRPDLS